MKVEDYIKNHAPKAQRSRLEQFSGDIHRLREVGMTLAQIAEFLSASGVTISTASLSRFLRKSRPVPTVPPAPESVTTPVANVPTRPPGITEAGWRELQIEFCKQKKFK
jgi:hypothetical protein